jgi:ribonuclease D
MELLKLDLPKTQTRTDWSRRPLTKEQLDYAAEDVAHLPELKSQLCGRLSDQGRLDWAVEDSRQLCDISLYKPNPSNAWQRIKSIPFLPAAEQARARALAAWREERALKANKPRQWIITDKALLQLAANNPASENAMLHVEDLPPPVVRKHGIKLLEILMKTNDALAAGELDLTQQIPDRSAENMLSKKLMKLVRAKAEEVGVAAEVLASKRDISALIRNEQSSRITNGWRYDVIGKELLAAL